METARVLRVLQDGGMVVPCQDGGAVYRDQDQRRRVAGLIKEAQLDTLIKSTLVRKLDGVSAGLIWANARADKTVAGSTTISPPTRFQRKRQARTALEYVLRAEKTIRKGRIWPLRPDASSKI